MNVLFHNSNSPKIGVLEFLEELGLNILLKFLILES